MTSTTNNNGGGRHLQLMGLAPEVRLLVWEEYFNTVYLDIKTCSRHPGLYIVEPELLRLRKALRKEALKPYVWRLKKDLLDVRRQLASFKRRGLQGDEPKDPGSTPRQMPGLSLQAETLEVEIRRVERVIEQHRVFGSDMPVG